MSNILGAPVLDDTGRRRGILEDLILDLRNSRVQSALVAAEDGRLEPVAPAALRWDAGRDRLVLARGRPPPPPPPEEARPALKRFVRASEVIARAVSDRTGTHAGEIEDLVLDLDNGLVLYALFDYDESWGPDQLPLRLALGDFVFSEEGGAVVNVARERLADPGPAGSALR